MALALILLVGAAVLARATGGSWDAFGAQPFKGLRLVVIAVAAQLIGSGLARASGLHGFYPTGLALSALAALAFCVRNVRLPGVPLVALGLLSNALVVAVNGAMPVSVAAAARANVPIAAIADGADPRHSIAERGTALRELGDDIPLPVPWRPEVVSPGDALIAAGLGEFVLLGMRPRRVRRTERDARARRTGRLAAS
jgi:Family of unknown function (DUF5317)